MTSHLQAFGGDSYGRDPAVPEFVVTTNNGFRAWELVYDDKRLAAPSEPAEHRLSSLVMKYEWVEGLNYAGCLITENEVTRRRLAGRELCDFPTKRCVCGFYAYYDVARWSQHPSRSARYQRVEGIIEGYGRCVVGNKGFRAEHAVIVGLVIPDVSELSTAWLGNRTTAQGRDDVVRILRAKLPSVQLYDCVEELLEATPLMGKPEIVRELEGEV